MKTATPQDTWDHTFGACGTMFSWWLDEKHSGVSASGDVQPGWTVELTIEDGETGDPVTKTVDHATVLKFARKIASREITKFVGQRTVRECQNLVFRADEADFDSALADELLQVVMLGEVVYG